MPSSYPKFPMHLLSENDVRHFLPYLLRRYEIEHCARKLLICNLMDEDADGVACKMHDPVRSWKLLFFRRAYNPFLHYLRYIFLQALIFPAVRLGLKALSYAYTVSLSILYFSCLGKKLIKVNGQIFLLELLPIFSCTCCCERNGYYMIFEDGVTYDIALSK